MLKLYVKQGDQRPIVQAEVVDGYGQPVDLTSAGATFSMWQVESATPTLDAVAATIASPTAGLLRYLWNDGDTDEPGSYVAEFTVTWEDQKKMTVPSRGFIEIEIQKKLTAPPAPPEP